MLMPSSPYRDPTNDVIPIRTAAAAKALIRRAGRVAEAGWPVRQCVVVSPHSPSLGRVVNECVNRPAVARRHCRLPDQKARE
ncbi:hypothetical protein I546_2536 [Mycobacterium kansasii 732]|nr:hypothetical protein I546_2536 [Mycobacterium kansasii 732]KZS62853.1 hypothetical protein A4G27_25600 [Mycobacterium kansasii]